MDKAARTVSISAQVIDTQQNKAGALDLTLPSGTRFGADAPQLFDAVNFRIDINPDAAPGVYQLLLVMYVPEGDFPKIGAYDAAGNFVGEQLVIMPIRVE